MTDKKEKILSASPGYKVINKWLAEKGRKAFTFQKEAWQQVINNRSGLVNAPTGFGKTYSIFLGSIIQFINEHPTDFKDKRNSGLRLLWITPLRALAKDIGRAMEEVVLELGMQWRIGIRNGDTPVSERQQQKRKMPEVLIITPESLHLFLAQKNYPEVFTSLKIVAVDEWHELLGSKRGVQVELALSRIVALSKKVKPLEETPGKKSVVKTLVPPIADAPEMESSTKIKLNAQLKIPLETFVKPNMSIWGISATIGNLEEARDVLMASLQTGGDIVRATVKKKLIIESVIPDEIERYPWAGHLGIRLAFKVLPILEQNKTTLIFINTRGMSEIWYQQLLTVSPDLAGAIALHHGSIERELRTWVEEALHEGTLTAVVCTSSLDLGVDFRPVETVIQVGSPKGVARFLQRAGRSGHQPDATSKIYFLPTHSLELLEAAALKEAMDISFIESRQPMLLCFDVLLQYMCTLAVSDGFYPDELYEEIKNTFCYSEITRDEFQQLLQFITAGGVALSQYDDYKKVEIIDGLYKITSRRIAMRHRMHIGTIVSDAMLKVKFMGGGFIGVIEEYFISRLNPGDVFTLAGRNLEFVAIKDMTAIVKKSTSKKSIVPSWNGGRLPLSANLGIMLRKKLNEAADLENYPSSEKELTALKPLFDLQKNYQQYLKKMNC